MKNLSYKDWINSREENFPYYNPAPKLTVSASEGIKTEENPNVTIQEEQVPIVASGVKYNNGNHGFNLETLKELHECGFNIGMQNAISSDYIEESLEAAAKAQVNLIFSQGMFYKDDNGPGITATLKQYLPFFGGVKLIDEIPYSEIGFQVDGKPTFIQGKYRDLMEQNTGCLIFINLIGSAQDGFMKDPVKDCNAEYEACIASSGENNSGDCEVQKSFCERDKRIQYIQYVTAFQRAFKPSFFCYDLYPIREHTKILYQGDSRLSEGYVKELNHVIEGEIEINYGAFYDKLRLFSQYSKEFDRPFWITIQGMSFLYLKFPGYYPMALENYIRFQAFSAIAYGAKGFVYWTYAMINNSYEECKMAALTDRQNHKTGSWYLAKQVNLEIQTYRDMILNTEVIDVYHVEFSKSFSKENSLLRFNLIVTTNLQNGILISYRKKNEQEYYIMVMSKNMLEYQEITIHVNKGIIRELTPITSGGEINKLLEKGENTRILIPGGYRIFRMSLEAFPVG